MSPRLSPLVALLVLALAAPARAQGGGATPADEILALQTEIARDVTQLTTGSCAVACQALASMKRASDRLCALDPGPRCADARAKVRDAERRVHASCGECQPVDGYVAPPVAAKPEAKPATELDKPAEKPAVLPSQPPPPPAPPASPPQPEEAVHASAPRSGGCAGCVAGGEEGVAGGGLLAVIGVVVAGARRRRRRG